MGLVNSRWPAVMEWGATSDVALTAGSWPFQLVFIRSQLCACGGRFEVGAHRVVPRGDDTLERHAVTCRRCGVHRAFWFDIGTFHNDPQASLRFEELRVLFQEGMAQVEEGDLDAARLRFKEVAAREPWFGLAHYHLGMIALVADDFDRAREYLAAAAAILPMDPNVHLALADLWSLLADEERELRARDVAETLEMMVEVDAPDDGE